MTRWQNWSGRHRSDVEQLAFVRSEADAAALVAACNAAGRSIRVAGAGHSHAPVVLNDQVIVDVSGLAGVVAVDQDAGTARVRAGSSIFSLGRQLHDHGLALRNQGDIDRQLLGGVIGTGTHGTGRDLQNIPASVLGLSLILPDGEQVTCDHDHEPDLFEVARLSLGSVGLITEVNLQLARSQVLKESGFDTSWEELVDQVPTLVDSHQRFEFFWYPGNDQATVKIINPTDEPPVYPLAAEGARQAWSFEVLPSHRPHLHTEMEYSVPAEDGLACFRDIRELLQSRFPDVVWPVEYRTVAADDIWLSMATGRPTVTISVHQDIRQDETDYYRACEEVFLTYGGRPHWGKVNYLDGEQLASRYPAWEQWWQVRDRYDPRGTFLNAYMRSIRP